MSLNVLKSIMLLRMLYKLPYLWKVSEHVKNVAGQNLCVRSPKTLSYRWLLHARL